MGCMQFALNGLIQCVFNDQYYLIPNIFVIIVAINKSCFTRRPQHGVILTARSTNFHPPVNKPPHVAVGRKQILCRHSRVYRPGAGSSRSVVWYGVFLTSSTVLLRTHLLLWWRWIRVAPLLAPQRHANNDEY